MEGNKLRLLYLRLSFLGFYLLAVLSCGIGLLWLMPYMQQTMVSFYLDVQDVKELHIADLHQLCATPLSGSFYSFISLSLQ